MELNKIKGISEKREQELNKAGIFSTGDLIRFFPRRYLDLTERQPLVTAYHNDFILTVGQVVAVPQNFYMARRGFVRVFCEQEGLSFTVVWLNQPYVLQKIQAAEEYLFYGRVQKIA
ncbi:MAG: hypothetical protein MJ072_04640, partial [Clostridia bacterium]|nr:hypothetical protein [Clostridia bacterium]